jgi:integrase
VGDQKRIRVWVQRFKDRPHLVLQWHDPDTGKRKSQSAETADPDEAEEARKDLEYELRHDKHVQGSRMSWARFREMFEQEYVAGRRPNTRLNYTGTFDTFERVCNPRTLRGITERTLSAFVAGVRKEPGRKKGTTGHAPGTIHTRLAYLRKALRWAAEQKLIPTLPHFPTVKVPRKRPQPVPQESYERLIAVAPDNHMRAFLMAGWLAGLRLSEAVALEWEPAEAAPYLDVARQRIVLPAEVAKSAEDQWVPLDPELAKFLDKLPRLGRRVFRFADEDGHLIGLRAIGSRVITLAKRAGVRLSMHSLRRGFGCRYAGKVPAQVLQRLMRHSNIATTMGYYANVDDAVMDAVLGPSRNATLCVASETRPRSSTPAPPSVADKANSSNAK